LHSFTAPEPLTSVSINDDHSVAVGTSEGTLIVYDVRFKGAIATISSGSLAAIKSLAFQPPKVGFKFINYSGRLIHAQKKRF
jgi:protein NEDD1